MASRPGTCLGSSLSCSVLLILLFCSKPHPVAPSWPRSLLLTPDLPLLLQVPREAAVALAWQPHHPWTHGMPGARGLSMGAPSQPFSSLPLSLLAPAQTNQELTYEATPQGMSAFPGLPRPPVWRLQWVKGPQEQSLCPILGPTEGYSLPDIF